jgi:CspA family cold shock protein
VFAEASSFLLEQARAFGNHVREEERISMSEGTIKKVVSDRGFGFIQAVDGKEYFFHRTGMDSSLNFDALTGGERVTFEVEPSQKGPRANRVRMA